ncbi:polysaccharide lyase 8 family protein, partial [Phytoactinopolyspora endophytica]|uniref:polysaccharide lyase 8 family protein n=1 Tax=Phytoactinopolyspora endophytica TaxID=1642495 RepID=UPI0013EBC14D
SMAINWATEGASHYRDATLRDTMLDAIDTVQTHNYIAGEPEDSSWYNHEIAIPQYLNNALTILHDHVGATMTQRHTEAVDWFVPDPRYNYPPNHPKHKLSTGGNRVDLCQVVMIRGALDHTQARVADGRDALSGVFEYTTSGDGYYRDGGFIQHTSIPYTGTYGRILLQGAATLIGLLADSPWEITDPDVEIMFDAVENCYAPTIYDNQLFSNMCGRAVSRKNSVEHGPAIGIVDGILTLAGAVDATRAKNWREMCLGWFTRDEFVDPTATSDLRRLALFKDLMNDSSLTPAPEPVGHQLMSSVARPIHRRDGWAFTVSMAREGVHGSYEHNRENLHGWYQGRGAAYLYVRSDNAQFSDAYWPTVDPLRLPGTTAQRRDDMPDGDWRKAYGHFGGGACVDGEYAATGMRMTKGPGEHSLSALKSWFCLDDSVVALGTGITSNEQYTVQSVMENRNLHENGANTLIVDGETMPADLGWDEYLGRPGWLHLADVAGYVVLDAENGSPLRGLREARTATWLDINPYWSTHDDTPYTRRYVTLYFGHGRAPTNRAYGYILLPGATPAETAARAADPGVQILAKTNTVHAIHVPHLGFTGANFFSGGQTIQLGGGATIATDKNCSVVLSQQGNEIWVGVANASHRLDSITVTLSGTSYSPSSSDSTVQVSKSGNTLTVAIDTSARDGRTHRAVLV